MLHLDDRELYDLPEAARRLLEDPARLARLARQGRVPLARLEGRTALPAAWVEAHSGASGADAEGLLRYWLERLAPPPREARRPARDARALEGMEVLEADAARRVVFADVARMARLDADGTLPALRLDGRTVYDARLAALVADADLDAEAAAEAERRRDVVRAWAAYEYVTGLEAGAAEPATETRPAPGEALAAAPRAWSLPEDLLADVEPLAKDAAAPPAEDAPPSRLIEADGFETVDED